MLRMLHADLFKLAVDPPHSDNFLHDTSEKPHVSDELYAMLPDRIGEYAFSDTDKRKMLHERYLETTTRHFILDHETGYLWQLKPDSDWSLVRTAECSFGPFIVRENLADLSVALKANFPNYLYLSTESVNKDGIAALGYVPL